MTETISPNDALAAIRRAVVKHKAVSVHVGSDIARVLKKSNHERADGEIANYDGVPVLLDSEMVPWQMRFETKKTVGGICPS